MKVNQIIHGDCVDIMEEMDAHSIDLTVTSPPYDKLRIYEGFRFRFPEIAQGLWRVTKQGGIIVWVSGDAVIDGSESGTSFKQALYFKEIGFRLHDTMIYEKCNFSQPSSTRYHQIFEYMFVLSKGKPKTFNPILDRKNKYGVCWGKNTSRQPDGTMLERKKNKPREWGMRMNIWRMNTAGQERKVDASIHPAMFPEQLARDHIISWSNPRDLVFDPMNGSGSTCKVARDLGRDYIGIDISAKYCESARQRIGEIKQ